MTQPPYPTEKLPLLVCYGVQHGIAIASKNKVAHVVDLKLRDVLLLLWLCRRQRLVKGDAVDVQQTVLVLRRIGDIPQQLQRRAHLQGT